MASENEKARLVRNSKKGFDSRADEVIDNPNGPQGKLFAKALVSWENKLRKSYIEAARFATDNLNDISRVVEIPVDILEVYYYFFFDVKDWDRLDKIEHIEFIGKKHKTEALLKMWTLTQGLDFLAWRLGKKVTISPVEGLVDLFSTCLFRSKEAMFNQAGTESSGEAIKWSKQSTDIARLLKVWVMDSSAAKKDLEIAIREVIPEFGGLDALLEEDRIEKIADGVSTEQQVAEIHAQITAEFQGISELEDENGTEE